MLAWRWGQGPDLVVVPGLEEAFLTPRALAWFARWLWAPLIERHGVRLTLLSFRESVPSTFSTLQMARDLAAAVDALDLRPLLVIGTSEGGLVASALVRRHPGMARGLVLLSTPLTPRVPPSLQRFYDHLIRLLRGSSPVQAYDHLVGVLFDAALMRRYRTGLGLVRRWGRRADLQRAERLVAAFRSHDEREAPPFPDLPVLLVSGGLDPLLLSEPGAEARRDPRAVQATRQVWLAGEHGAYLEFRETVLQELLRFVADLQGRDVAPDAGDPAEPEARPAARSR